jgi:hypothetical protein
MQRDDLLNKIEIINRKFTDDWSIIFGNGDDFFHESLVDNITKYFKGVEKNLVCVIKTSYPINFITSLLPKIFGKVWELEVEEVKDPNNEDSVVFMYIIVLKLRNPNFWEPPIRIKLIVYTFALLRYFSKPYAIDSSVFSKYGERPMIEQLNTPTRFLIAAAEIATKGEYYLNISLYDFIHTFLNNNIDKRRRDYLPIKAEYPLCVFSYLDRIFCVFRAKNYLKNALRKVTELNISNMSDILSREYDNMKREF